MLAAIARTRPILSPSHPKATPPSAAPRRNAAVAYPIHIPTNASVSTMFFACCISSSAGRAINGKMPISMPSNIQPRKAAIRTAYSLFLSGSVVAMLVSEKKWETQQLMRGVRLTAPAPGSRSPAGRTPARMRRC